MEKAGEITPEQAQSLKNLSNKGFDISNAFENAEGLARECNGDYDCYYDKIGESGSGIAGNIYEENSFYMSNMRTPGYFKYDRGSGENYLNSSNYFYEMRNYENSNQTDLLMGFLHEYGQASNSGALDNPALNELVGFLVKDIVNVTDQARYLHNNTPNKLAESTRQVERDSSDICTAGGDQASSRTCS